MPRELKPCGTVAAARRHQRNGEPLCGKCQQALRDEKNDRKDAERSKAAEQVKHTAEPISDGMTRLGVLYNLRKRLFDHMDASAPQNVSPIAAQIRAVSAEIAELAEAEVKPEVPPVNELDELAQIRTKRAS